tara:strand:+ start:2156 stop:3079 length:924 start_codon:yes stop_codon:yes gene_type:complete
MKNLKQNWRKAMSIKIVKIYAMVLVLITPFIFAETPGDEREKLGRNEINVMDGGDLCPKVQTKKYNHHMILIDATTSLRPDQIDLLQRLVLDESYLRQMPPLDKISIMVLSDVLPSQNRPILSVCRPRSGDPSSPYKIDKHNYLIESITDLTGVFEKKFIGGIDKAIQEIAQSSPSASIGSPIMGQLKEISRLPDLDFTNNSGYESRKLTIVSDLAQNTKKLPFYDLCPTNKSRNCPSWEKFKKNKKYKLWANQAKAYFNEDVEVNIIYLNSFFDPNLDKGVLDFWYSYLEDSGVTKINFDIETEEL